MESKSQFELWVDDELYERTVDGWDIFVTSEGNGYAVFGTEKGSADTFIFSFSQDRDLAIEYATIVKPKQAGKLEVIRRVRAAEVRAADLLYGEVEPALPPGIQREPAFKVDEPVRVLGGGESARGQVGVVMSSVDEPIHGWVYRVLFPVGDDVFYEHDLEAAGVEGEPEFKEGGSVRVKLNAPSSYRGYTGVVSNSGVLPPWKCSVLLDKRPKGGHFILDAADLEAFKRPKFKDGDPVRAVGGTKRFRGMVGTVEFSAYLPVDGWIYRVRLPLGIGGTLEQFRENYIEAAEVETPKAKFKVGDGVRVKKVNPERYSGLVGIVKRVPFGHWGCGVEINKKSGILIGFHEHEIEAIEEVPRDE